MKGNAKIASTMLGKDKKKKKIIVTKILFKNGYVIEILRSRKGVFRGWEEGVIQNVENTKNKKVSKLYKEKD